MNAFFYSLAFAFLVITNSCSHKEADAVSSVPWRQRDGLSFEKAVVITSKTEKDGAKAERWVLAKCCPGYKILDKNRTDHSGKPYDIIKIRSLSGAEVIFYFNISLFFGK